MQYSSVILYHSSILLSRVALIDLLRKKKIKKLPLCHFNHMQLKRLKEQKQKNNLNFDSPCGSQLSFVQPISTTRCLLTLSMDCAPSVTSETRKLVADTASHFGRCVKQFLRHRMCRVGTWEVWMGASRGQTVESLVIFTATWGFLQRRVQQSIMATIILSEIVKMD